MGATWLERRLDLRSRWLVSMMIVPLLLAVIAPIWQMRFEAPQYPAGLGLDIYTYTVAGDVQEVNTLNHYIGMSRIDRTALSDLSFLPFAIGAFGLLALRVAALGDVRSLLDLLALYVYFGAFAFARFAYTLYVFGHNLDERAPFEMEPFTPPILGTKQIANFTTTAFPGGATFLISVFALGLVALVAWNLYLGARSRADA